MSRTSIQGIEPSQAKGGTIVLVFGKIVWNVDKELVDALQTEHVLAPFKCLSRALNTKVLAFPWVVPATQQEASAQRGALEAHKEIVEVHAFAMPELATFFFDDDGKPAAYLDGGELTVAMARANPEHLADVMTYLRAPQRQDWFMDALVEVAEATKGPAERALVYDAVCGMPVPAASNKHHKTYVSAVNAGAAAYRAAKDSANAERLEKKAAMFVKSRARK